MTPGSGWRGPLPGEPGLRHLRRLRLRADGLLLQCGLHRPEYYITEGILIGLGVLVVGCLGYIIAQWQWGRPIRLRDPSEEAPSPEVYELMGETTRPPATVPSGR